MTWRSTSAAAAALLGLACGSAEPAAPPPEPDAAGVEIRRLDPDRVALRARAVRLFGTLPDEVPNPEYPVTDAKVELGRLLYYDPRLSRSQQISCNSCHLLDRFGVDGEPTSVGHGGTRGARNAPTVYNAALHIAQFWDGRAADVEELAKGPVLNPDERAMPSEDRVVGLLRSIPGYRAHFEAAFPEAEDPIDDDHAARAIGAFERRLLTPSPFDDFLAGDDAALGEQPLRGLERFMDTGCTTCHNGVAIGGDLYQKLGLVRPYPTDDVGREAVTGNEAHRHFFKVPSLRNVAETAPYFHDGSIATLDEAIGIMAAVQLDRDLRPDEIAEIRAFLESLTGRIDAERIARPELPPSGPDTPGPETS